MFHNAQLNWNVLSIVGADLQHPETPIGRMASPLKWTPSESSMRSSSRPPKVESLCHSFLPQEPFPAMVQAAKQYFDAGGQEHPLAESPACSHSRGQCSNCNCKEGSVAVRPFSPRAQDWTRLHQQFAAQFEQPLLGCLSANGADLEVRPVSC